jgi:hypothetical protein
MASELRLDLIVNGAATGVAQMWQGGRGTFFVDGTFSGATIKLQAQMPIGTTSTWVDVGPNVTLTAAGIGNFELPPLNIRAAVVDGPPSGVYASVIGTRVS